MSRLALTMIVRDEADWIEPCIQSARELGIDRWLIADTGSVDSTKELVEELLADIPGELFDLPWEGHGKTRTELLRRAFGIADWLLMLDADMALEGELELPLEEMEGDVYDAVIHHPMVDYSLPILVRGTKRWRFDGPAHCYLASDQGDMSWDVRPSGLVIDDRRPGGFREGKLEEDARLFEEALALEPMDARSSFYLAQSYANLGRTGDAIREYGRRALLGGWEEERYVAKLRRARLLESVDSKVALHAYLDAWDDRPTRAEALHGAARLSRIGDSPWLAHMFASWASKIPPTSDRLFVEPGVWEWGIPFELGAACIAIGRVEEGRALLGGILAEGKAPEAWLSWVTEILQASEPKEGA